MKIRESYKIPAIILSAKTEESDKVSGLVLGADDYVSNPYNATELIARVKAQLRRYNSWGGGSPASGKDKIINGGLVLDKKQRIVIAEGKETRLTATEYKILSLLMENAGQVFPAEQIYESVWNEEATYAVENTVMVHIRHIREKIEIDTKNPKYIADKAKAFLKENISSVTGTVAFILGLIMLVFLSDKVKYYVSSKETWGFGIIMNVFIGIAVYLILSDVLKNIYRDWLPENSDFYSSWKSVWRKQQRILWTAGGALFFIAMFFLISQMTYSRYYYSNFAFGYLLVATAVVQFGIAKLTVTRFMNRRLDLLMDSVNEINKEQLCEAIEIEKNSIEKAAKSEQLKVDLISNVSHDLKTPLTSMVGYLGLLKKEELDDVSKDYVNVISDKAQKLKEMIESLFSLAKASSGNMQFNMESIELNRLIEQIFADMDDKIRDSDLKFVNMLTEEDTHMVTDNIHM